MPTSLSITVATNAGGTDGGNVTATVVTLTIPAALQSLDSGNSGGQGQVASYNSTTQMYSGGQSGYSSVDQAVRNIYRAGGFFSSTGIWYGIYQIQSISWS